MKQTAGSGGEKAIDWTGVFAGEMKGGLRMEINTGSIFRILKTHRKSILIFSLFALMAAGLGVKGRMEAQDLAGKAVRAAEGGSTQSRTFTFRLENSDQQELAVDIAPVERSAEEAEQLLAEAFGQWEDCYLGENVSPEEIRTDLTLPEELCGGLVQVSYESSDCNVLQSDGKIVSDTLPEDGELIELTVYFSYGSYSRRGVCGLLVMPPETGSEAWFRMQLQKEIQQTESDTRQEESFSLPDTIAGNTIYWEEKKDFQWILVLFLGAVAAICLERKEKEAQKIREKRRKEQLIFEYPRMVDQMAILLESGMTIRKAWERMTERRTKPGDPMPAYQAEMLVTYREMQEGRGEREAYERFGNRIGLLPYRRFSSVLAQNLSKGTRDIRQLLRKEAAEALEMRKNRARKAGEEAGTKMLFPMLVMLVLILLVLLLPALTGL